MFFCCCDFSCDNLFQDSFDGGDLSDDWVNPENLTYNGDGTATLAANTVVSITPTLTNGSGHLTITHQLAANGDFLIVRFAKKDANNYWWVKITRDTDPYGGVPDAHFAEYWERISGVDQYRGERICPGLIPTIISCDPDAQQSINICWMQGKRTYVFSPCTSLDWPNSITGGNSFEIEAGDSDVLLHHVNLNPAHQTDCPCQVYQCMTCNGELNDTMQIEIIGGPDDGMIFIADRYLDWPFFTTAGVNCINTNVSYWQFYTPCSGVIGDYFLQVAMCKQIGSLATEPYLRILESPAAGDEFNTFTIEDCEGPWDVEVELDYSGTPHTVTFRITPL